MAADPNMHRGWETSEFPILCGTCLGDNPYVRMSKESHGKECKICVRPFTIFRWVPGAGMRMKKTEICQTCAKIKNVCQTCVLDLEFGLPVEVRDTLGGVQEEMPTSDINKQFYVHQAEAAMADGTLTPSSAGGKMDAAGREQLKKLARTEPYYKRNRAHLCSFYAKGTCNRGSECPYRHELPVVNELSHQNIQDRYYGHNDPVAKKILNRTDRSGTLEAPSDPTVTSLFLQNVEPDITEADLRGHFYAYGDIKSIVVARKARVAFVNYATREAAERAVEKSFNNTNIKGHVIRVQWGKPKSQGPKSVPLSSSAPVPAREPTLDEIAALDAIPPPPGAEESGQVRYAAMDPTQLGQVPLKKVLGQS
ncbi:RNA binding motif protein 22 [Gonapodya sp. JEL0774]|nr:RNA binding motif protein 22 [Gonapodya sp. JEL0774]